MEDHLARICTRMIIALALIGAGWTIGNTQARQPDFGLIVDAPGGETRIEYVRGCELAWVERGLNPNGAPGATFSYGCGSVGVGRCSSGRVGGWLR